MASLFPTTMTDPTLCQPLRLAEPITGGPFRRGGRFSPATWRKFSVQLASLIRYMQLYRHFFFLGIIQVYGDITALACHLRPPCQIKTKLTLKLSRISSDTSDGLRILRFKLIHHSHVSILAGRKLFFFYVM